MRAFECGSVKMETRTTPYAVARRRKLKHFTFQSTKLNYRSVAELHIVRQLKRSWVLVKWFVSGTPHIFRLQEDNPQPSPSLFPSTPKNNEIKSDLHRGVDKFFLLFGFSGELCINWRPCPLKQSERKVSNRTNHVGFFYLLVAYSYSYSIFLLFNIIGDRNKVIADSQVHPKRIDWSKVVFWCNYSATARETTFHMIADKKKTIINK